MKNFQKNSKIIEYNLYKSIPFKNKDLLDGLIKEIKKLISKDGLKSIKLRNASNKGMLGWVTSIIVKKNEQYFKM